MLVSRSHIAVRYRYGFGLAVLAPLLLLYPAQLHAQTLFYVSPAGIDSNPGSELQPFRTIQRAASLVNPGDTVIVEDGIYTGVGTGTSCASAYSRPVVCLARGGTATAWVTFKARHIGGARIDGLGNTSTDGFRFLANANYIRVEGFEVYGVGNASGSASGFELFNGGHDVVLRHNDIHDVGRLCTDTTNGQVGIFLEQPNVRIESNRIHDIGRYALNELGCSPATSYYTNHDHGIYVDGDSAGTATPGARDTVIVNNLFYNHARGWSIQVYPGTISGLRILNNTFAFANPYKDGHIILGANLVDAQLANNIFYSPRTAGIYYYSGSLTNVQITQNVVYNAVILSPTPAGVFVMDNLVADPVFNNISTTPYDLHVQPGSPAIDRGLTVAATAVDFDEHPRIGAYDVGAYELNSVAVTAPPIITPPGATFSGSISVALSTTTPGATIHYTTDGSMPGPLTPLYVGAFTLDASALVRAQASAAGMADSAVQEAAFQLQAPIAPPSDSTPPIVVITSPKPGNVVRQVTVTASASDNVAIKNVKFTIDGAVISTDSSAPYSIMWNSKKGSTGSHVIGALATDTSGNTATASITVNVVN
jgi:hypothetical protein